MEHFFDLPIIINGEEQLIACRLMTFGYVYKYHVIIDKQEVIFERDEGMEFRVLNRNSGNSLEINENILKDIIVALEKLSN